MSILSWNCQGLGSFQDLTIPRLKELRKKYFPDIFFLMETMNCRNVVVDLHAWLGYDRFVVVNPEGKSGGLALFWKNSVLLNVLTADKNLIDVHVQFGSSSFYVSFIYGDPTVKNRANLWERISRIGLSRRESWNMVGDFNDLLHNGEKIGGPKRSNISFQPFSTMISNCQMDELPSKGNGFSWGGRRGDHWIQCRLDRSFGNRHWFHSFPASNQTFLEKRGSDHRPVLIHLVSSQDPYRGHFKFDKRFLFKPEVKNKILQVWSTGTSRYGSKVSEKLRLCRKSLSKWKRDNDLNAQDKIHHLQEELEKQQSVNSPNFQAIKQLKKELCIANKEEEAFWQQKSRAKWLKDGDLNTKYFHASVKTTRTRNWIAKLRDSQGIEHRAEASKGSVAADYFKELFSSSNPPDYTPLFQGFTPRVTQQMNEELIKDVSDEEIKAAVFSIKSSSAPGADGMTGLFYQQYWDIVSQEVISEVRSFFTEGILPKEWNYTQLFLLPKVTDPNLMSDLRPISLCNVLYKIISKILAKRLQPFLGDIVSPSQSAFVPQRLISDNILIAHEAVHSLRTHPQMSKEYIAVKSDMSKAFDRVEWSYLHSLLIALGFHPTWVNWIKLCVTTVTFTVLMNNQPYGLIEPQRGLRQGDPLSPILFVLCTEGLTHMLNQAEEQELIHGMKFTEAGPSISHLLFADDSLFICKKEAEECENLLSILQIYGKATGQVVNLNKSSINFGSNICGQEKTRVQKQFGIMNEGGAGSYLGLPECFSGSKIDLLDYIHQKLKNRLNGWFARKLSMGGKEILLKAIAMALPVYAMSCYKLPKSTCKSLTSAMTEFWWNSEENKRKIHWVSWENMCLSKEHGGLGFRDLECFNQALLSKQAWRLIQYPQSLCASFLKSRYHEDLDFLDSRIGSRPSFAWRSLHHGKDLLIQGLHKRLGNGKTLEIWKDPWIKSLQWRAPWIKNPLSDLELKVCSLIDDETGYWNEEALQEHFFDPDIRLIKAMRPMPDQEDYWTWLHTKSGDFSVKSAYWLANRIKNGELIREAEIQPSINPLLQKVWQLKTSSKIKNFLWRTLRGALPAVENLRRRGLRLDPRCQFCEKEGETVNHILFTCTVARQTWALFGFPHPENGFSATSLYTNMAHLLQINGDINFSLETRRAFPWILWRLWKNRNAFCIEGKRFHPLDTREQINDDIDKWFSAQVVINNFNSAESEKEEERQRKWLPPKPSWLKCNIGAAWSKQSGIGGGSWVLRDENGKVILHSRRAFSQAASLPHTQLQALLWSIQCMKDHRISQVTIAFENGNLVKAFQNPTKWPNLIPEVADIRKAMNHLINADIVWEARHRNRGAHQIAQSVVSRRQLQSYVEVGSPSWLQPLFLSEQVSSSV